MNLLIQNVPHSFGEFRKITNTVLQGLDPEYDIYYWNLWNDTRSTDSEEFSRFMNKIAQGEI